MWIFLLISNAFREMSIHSSENINLISVKKLSLAAEKVTVDLISSQKDCPGERLKSRLYINRFSWQSHQSDVYVRIYM